MKKVKVNITGMHCMACAMAVEDALLKTPNVKKAKVDLKHSCATIKYEESIDMAAVKEAVKAAGFIAED